MKALITILIVTLLGLGAYFHIEQRTREITRQMIEDDMRTEWVKAAKAVKNESDTIASDTIKVWGDELR